MKNAPVHNRLILDHVVDPPTVLAHVLSDDGIFPNSTLPLLIYRQSVIFPQGDPAGVLEKLFNANQWGGAWRNGIYPYHHYHSTAHEVLGIYRGSAKIQLGGEKGIIHEAEPGDVIIIPAGVAHKNLGSTRDFGVVGAYPDGQAWDMNYGKPGERPQADQNISRVQMPKSDPLYDATGPLLEKWNAP